MDTIYFDNTEIPADYQDEILKALTHYPELKGVHIIFRKKRQHPVPYSTSPSLWRILTGRTRKYTITLREKAFGPTQKALFKNLTPEMRRGVIGHELGHVVQYESMSNLELLRFCASLVNRSNQQKFERGADTIAIEHGLGEGLHKHAVYIRSIDGYIKERPEIVINYLAPAEILQKLIQ